MKLLFLSSLLACCGLSGLVSEKSVLVGSPVPVEAAIGEDVILPCHLEPPFDVHKLFVKWERNETDVHTYRSLADDLDAQDKSFKNRTCLFRDEMVKGNISLKLFNVTEQDEGVYTCFVLIQEILVKMGDINLKVVPEDEDFGRIVNPTSGPDRSTDGNNFPPGAIGGIAIGVIAFIVIVIGIVVKRKCGQQQEDLKYEASPDEVQNLQNKTTSV